MIRRILSAAVLVALMAPAAADGSFPGRNGKIAFVHEDFVGPIEVWTVNPDGSGATNLTSGSPAADYAPAWSPDGQKIAFGSVRDGNSEVYVMDADGAAQQRITNNPAGDSGPGWSPDGQRIVFASNRDGNSELYVMNADGSGATRMTNTPSVDESDPVWSPDGRTILFDAGSTGINAINADGSGRRTVSAVSPADYGAEWSPDSREIWGTDPFMDICEQDMTRLFVIDLDTGEPDIQFDGSCSSSVSDPAVSPDKSEIAMNYYCCDLMVFTRQPQAVRHLNVNGFDLDWQPIPYTGYARPKGATPMRLPLVPAYTACTSPHSTHGAPLSFGACAPPAPQATSAFIGIGDGDPAPAKSIGSVTLKALTGAAAPPDGADLEVNVSITNVMKPADRSDYTGELRLELPLRITDRFNKPPASLVPGTVSDTSFFATVPCVPTVDPTAGSACALSTTADGLLPGTARAGARAIWGLSQIRLHDGGADGDADTPGDNELLAVQGLFVP